MSQPQPKIEVPTNVDIPEIPSQYWGTGTGMIFAVAFLIRSTAMLIQSLVLMKTRCSQPKEVSSNPPDCNHPSTDN